MAQRSRARLCRMVAAIASALFVSGSLRGADPVQVVRPQDMKRLMARRAPALRAAMKRKRISLCREDFESFPIGPVGTGEHGQAVLGGRFRLGYPGNKKPGTNLRVDIRIRRGAKVLAVVDRLDGGAIYPRLEIGVNKGAVSFDLEMPRVRPMQISLGAYQVVLTVPNRAMWRKWFGRKRYRPTFVYLEGQGPGYNPHVRTQRESYRPVNTRVRVRPSTRYRITITWDQTKRRSSVIVNGRKVVDELRYLSNIFKNTESVVWNSGSFMDRGLRDNAEFYIDNIEAHAEVWRRP